MSVLATVFAPLHFFPQVEDLEPFAPGATIEVDRSAQKATVQWGDLTVTMTRLPDEQMGARLLALQKYVREKGGGEALAIRVLSALSVYEFVASPGIDVEQRAMGLVVSVVQATMGLCLLDGEVLDERGCALFTDPLRAPSAKRVALRCLALLSVAMRGLIEDDAGKPDQAEAESFRERLVDYTEAVDGLAKELEPGEHGLLRTAIGQAERQSVVDAVWRAEGAQVLLWALGMRELPAHDVQEHPFAVAQCVGILHALRPKVLDAGLRRTDELEWLRIRLLALHWRMVEARLEPAKVVAFERAAKRDFLQRVDLAGIPLVDGDLTFQGVRVSELGQQQIQLGQSIVRERHQAANWLLGVHPVYSCVNTPT